MLLSELLEAFTALVASLVIRVYWDVSGSPWD